MTTFFSMHCMTKYLSNFIYIILTMISYAMTTSGTTIGVELSQRAAEADTTRRRIASARASRSSIPHPPSTPPPAVQIRAQLSENGALLDSLGLVVEGGSHTEGSGESSLLVGASSAAASAAVTPPIPPIATWVTRIVRERRRSTADDDSTTRATELQVGDLVLSIDGRPVAPYNPREDEEGEDSDGASDCDAAAAESSASAAGVLTPLALRSAADELRMRCVEDVLFSRANAVGSPTRNASNAARTVEIVVVRRAPVAAKVTAPPVPPRPARIRATTLGSPPVPPRPHAQQQQRAAEVAAEEAADLVTEAALQLALDREVDALHQQSLAPAIDALSGRSRRWSESGAVLSRRASAGDGDLTARAAAETMAEGVEDRSSGCNGAPRRRLSAGDANSLNVGWTGAHERRALAVEAIRSAARRASDAAVRAAESDWEVVSSPTAEDDEADPSTPKKKKKKKKKGGIETYDALDLLTAPLVECCLLVGQVAGTDRKGGGLARNDWDPRARAGAQCVVLEQWPRDFDAIPAGAAALCCLPLPPGYSLPRPPRAASASAAADGIDAEAKAAAPFAFVLTSEDGKMMHGYSLMFDEIAAQAARHPDAAVSGRELCQTKAVAILSRVPLNQSHGAILTALKAMLLDGAWAAAAKEKKLAQHCRLVDPLAIARVAAADALEADAAAEAAAEAERQREAASPTPQSPLSPEEAEKKATGVMEDGKIPSRRRRPSSFAPPPPPRPRADRTERAARSAAAAATATALTKTSARSSSSKQRTRGGGGGGSTASLLWPLPSITSLNDEVRSTISHLRRMRVGVAERADESLRNGGLLAAAMSGVYSDRTLCLPLHTINTNFGAAAHRTLRQLQRDTLKSTCVAAVDALAASSAAAASTTTVVRSRKQRPASVAIVETLRWSPSLPAAPDRSTQEAQRHGSRLVGLERSADARARHLQWPSVRRALEPAVDDAALAMLFQRLRFDDIVTLVGALLLERKVLFHVASSAELGVLAKCTAALMALAAPSTFQHQHIPILHPSMAPLVSSPVPYLMGALTATLALLPEGVRNDPELIVVDLGGDGGSTASAATWTIDTSPAAIHPLRPTDARGDVLEKDPATNAAVLNAGDAMGLPILIRARLIRRLISLGVRRLVVAPLENNKGSTAKGRRSYAMVATGVRAAATDDERIAVGSEAWARATGRKFPPLRHTQSFSSDRGYWTCCYCTMRGTAHCCAARGPTSFQARRAAGSLGKPFQSAQVAPHYDEFNITFGKGATGLSLLMQGASSSSSAFDVDGTKTPPAVAESTSGSNGGGDGGSGGGSGAAAATAVEKRRCVVVGRFDGVEAAREGSGAATLPGMNVPAANLERIVPMLSQLVSLSSQTAATAGMRGLEGQRRAAVSCEGRSLAEVLRIVRSTPRPFTLRFRNPAGQGTGATISRAAEAMHSQRQRAAGGFHRSLGSARSRRALWERHCAAMELLLTLERQSTSMALAIDGLSRATSEEEANEKKAIEKEQKERAAATQQRKKSSSGPGGDESGASAKLPEAATTSSTSLSSSSAPSSSFRQPRMSVEVKPIVTPRKSLMAGDSFDLDEDGAAVGVRAAMHRARTRKTRSRRQSIVPPVDLGSRMKPHATRSSRVKSYSDALKDRLDRLRKVVATRRQSSGDAACGESDSSGVDVNATARRRRRRAARELKMEALCHEREELGLLRERICALCEAQAAGDGTTLSKKDRHLHRRAGGGYGPSGWRWEDEVQAAFAESNSMLLIVAAVPEASHLRGLTLGGGSRDDGEETVAAFEAFGRDAAWKADVESASDTAFLDRLGECTAALCAKPALVNALKEAILAPLRSAREAQELLAATVASRDKNAVQATAAEETVNDGSLPTLREGDHEDDGIAAADGNEFRRSREFGGELSKDLPLVAELLDEVLTDANRESAARERSDSLHSQSRSRSRSRSRGMSGGDSDGGQWGANSDDLVVSSDSDRYLNLFVARILASLVAPTAAERAADLSELVAPLPELFSSPITIEALYMRCSKLSNEQRFKRVHRIAGCAGGGEDSDSERVSSHASSAAWACDRRADDDLPLIANPILCADPWLVALFARHVTVSYDPHSSMTAPNAVRLHLVPNSGSHSTGGDAALTLPSPPLRSAPMWGKTLEKVADDDETWSDVSLRVASAAERKLGEALRGATSEGDAVARIVALHATAVATLCYARRARRIALKATILARNERHGENEWIDTQARDTSWIVDLLRVSAVWRHAVALLDCRLAPLLHELQSVADCGVGNSGSGSSDPAAAAGAAELEAGAMSASRAVASFDSACDALRHAADAVVCAFPLGEGRIGLESGAGGASGRSALFIAAETPLMAVLETSHLTPLLFAFGDVRDGGGSLQGDDTVGAASADAVVARRRVTSDWAPSLASAALATLCALLRERGERQSVTQQSVQRCASVSVGVLEMAASATRRRPRYPRPAARQRGGDKCGGKEASPLLSPKRGELTTHERAMAAVGGAEVARSLASAAAARCAKRRSARRRFWRAACAHGAAARMLAAVIEVEATADYAQFLRAAGYGGTSKVPQTALQLAIATLRVARCPSWLERAAALQQHAEAMKTSGGRASFARPRATQTVAVASAQRSAALVKAVSCALHVACSAAYRAAAAAAEAAASAEGHGVDYHASFDFSIDGAMPGVKEEEEGMPFDADFFGAAAPVPATTADEEVHDFGGFDRSPNMSPVLADAVVEGGENVPSVVAVEPISPVRVISALPARLLASVAPRVFSPSVNIAPLASVVTPVREGNSGGETWAVVPAACADGACTARACELAILVTRTASARAAVAAHDAWVVAHSLGASHVRTQLMELMIAVARVEAEALRACEPQALPVAFSLLDAATWPVEARAAAELVRLLVTSAANDFDGAVRRNSASLPPLPVPPRRAGNTSGGAVRLSTQLPPKPSRLTPAEDDRQWRYSVVAPRGVPILRAPEHPGHKTGVRIAGGVATIIDKRVDVAHYPPRPMMARLTGRAGKQPPPFTLTFLHLADGRGWVCDRDASREKGPTQLELLGRVVESDDEHDELSSSSSSSESNSSEERGENEELDGGGDGLAPLPPRHRSRVSRRRTQSLQVGRVCVCVCERVRYREGGGGCHSRILSHCSLLSPLRSMITSMFCFARRDAGKVSPRCSSMCMAQCALSAASRTCRVQ